MGLQEKFLAGPAKIVGYLEDKLATSQIYRDKEETLKLSNLLKLVGAREQLAKVRKDWRSGRVDRKLEDVYNIAFVLSRYSFPGPDDNLLSSLPSVESKTPGLGLTLRYRFRDVEEALVDRYDGPKEKGSYLNEHELFLLTVVGFNETNSPFVVSLAGLRRSESWLRRAYSSGHRRPYADLKEDNGLCISHSQAEMIFPDKPAESRRVLEGQLSKICKELKNPRRFEEAARYRILHDGNLPFYIRNTVSPVWYQRVPSRIVDRVMEYGH